MTRFALTVVRHGETRLNKEKVLQGQGIDEPLSETGFKQAAAAGRFMSKVRFTHAFSSDLTRAKQTMHGILKHNLFCKDMTVQYDSRLRERLYQGHLVCECPCFKNVSSVLKSPGWAPVVQRAVIGRRQGIRSPGNSAPQWKQSLKE
ncbi:fructose-2,6-bisphosphatase TIGAR isoform X3 [Marmota flaviventris]|uniref:fructose-2,6-bisphosphatase TIGAR isoform X3 n=1 Tax=Marmota flaviventris TaxID=93162 RepID=UPI003A8840FD